MLLHSAIIVAFEVRSRANPLVCRFSEVLADLTQNLLPAMACWFDCGHGHSLNQ
jgi:hypothetical protein